MGEAVGTAGSSKSHANVGPIARVGLVSGALAGAFMALSDYGAMWLWLPLWRDRGGLLLRLLLALMPVGALCGALVATLGAWVWNGVSKRSQRPALWWPLPFVILALPGLRVLSVKLCSGGMMSRLSFHDALVWGLTLALPCALYVALALALRIARALPARPGLARGIAIALLGTAFALDKINQVVLPNLYEYLHAGLALIAWGLAALGSATSLFSFVRLGPWRQRLLSPRFAYLAGAALLVALAINALTLNLNLNVRVAMFDARSPTSRALLAGTDPVLRFIEGRDGKGQIGRGLARGAVDTTGLPTQQGAHVLLITIDALRADHLGSYGYARPTSPELDAFAKGATQFQRVYAQAPHSSYSLSSLHTSEYIHEVVELGRALPKDTLATTLAQHGYHTAAFFTDGVFHTEGTKLSVYRDSAFGFALFDHTNRESEDQTDRVLQEVDRIKSMGEPPSFLWVHLFDVHEPYQQTTFGTGELDRYDSEIRHVDREAARLIREVQKRFEREVVIAITADHGEEFREHGGVYHGSTLYEEQLRVPLILRAAALPAKRIEPPLEVIDVAPTLLGILGIEAPASMRGRDLRAIAMGRVTDPGPVFSAVLTKRMALRWPYKIVADLRFGLFELYDLTSDPKERKNLASQQPQKLAEMRGLVYAWLDSLEAPRGEQAVTSKDDEWARALRWGRLGDRRAVSPMSALLLDTKAPTEMRIEAGQILAKLADTSCAPALVKGMGTHPPEVAAEAAIALGRMYDERARGALKRLVYVEDPSMRARAAVSLGRLRDKEAVPALIDALWVAPTQYEREEAVRWLGRLQDKRAVEPLLSIIPEFGLRYLVPVALGQIGDARAYDALADMLEWEHHTNIRDEVVRGLGSLRDPRAVPALVNVLETEPALKNTAESLVRLGALERGYLGGVDLAPNAKGVYGFERCDAGPLFHDWDYLQRTSCVARGDRVQAKLALPKTHARWNGGAILIVRARRVDAPEPSEVTLSLGNQELTRLRIDGSWGEQRVTIEPSLLSGASLRLSMVNAEPKARLAVDHLLLVPRSDALLAEPSALPKASGDTQPVP